MEETESNSSHQAIVLTIRPSSGSTFTTAISIESTVLQLKEKLATPDLPVASIRLVYSGRVLKDEDQLSTYSIKEGHTIHMVKSASNRANEQAVQTVRPLNNNSASGPEGFDEQGLMATLLDNPAIRDMMANPEVVRRMMMANPQTREVMENNPEVAQMLNDPSFLRQSLDMARNPKLMKQALRNNDRALSNLEMIPGGFNHLRRMYHSVQEPMEASRSAPEPSTDDLNAQFAARLNADTSPHAGELNTTALPNPWAPPRQSNTARASPMFPGMPGTSGNSASSLGGLNLFANPFAGLEAPNTGAPGQSANTQASQNPFGAMMNQRTGGMGGMGGMGGGPQASPFGLQGMGEGFPPMGNNPEMFQQMMQFQQMMRQMQQQQQQPISQPPMTGFPSFANMFRGMPPLADPTASSNASSTTPRPTLNIADSTEADTTTPSTQQLEERFESQLASLRDMGFSDNSRNVRALLASGGDVHSAIEFLLRM
ncbi:Ubiquilin-4 [Mortierella sp. AM989]|nr:Ubiquilin-4 [Mortierella sp. AM989]